MKAVVSPGAVYGEVTAPPSKSMTHRAAILAALAEGASMISSPLVCDDTLATVEALKALGAEIVATGSGWTITGRPFHSPLSPIDCRESGTTMRLMTAVSALADGDVTLRGGISLSKRPMKPLLNALNAIGVSTSSDSGYPPVTVRGKGGITGGRVEVPGNISSQYISALLMAAPKAERPISLSLTTPLQSKPYVEMTMEAMATFGVKVDAASTMNGFNVPVGNYHAADVAVEGDWSSAAYLLSAGAFAGEVTIRNLDRVSKQADKAIIDVLDEMGARVKIAGKTATCSMSMLDAIEYDLSDCPDLFPVVAVLCSVAEGTSRLTGIERLRLKESDRVKSMEEGLRRMKVNIKSSEEEAAIKGGQVSGAEIDPHMDHRVAMSFAVLALAADGATVIRDAECVTKSYPQFWGHLDSVGANNRREDNE
ncbi:3-phosphoshikimate 1-carboxyvinyltransferase [Candidatus Bathyarchaeota archaeon]|nr:3-phosphoshikimate 1-carboxyvinyltransferase [Candidatus Bathyarchaeota archaeon]